jgi:hypothetical protein
MNLFDIIKGTRGSLVEAHRIAQQNAALPFSEGGLGLPPNNTAMQRARAMGYDTRPSSRVYHGTRSDEVVDIDPSKSDYGFHVGNVDQANNRLEGLRGNTVAPDEGENIIPLMINKYANFLPARDEGTFHADTLSGQLAQKGLISRARAKEVTDAIFEDWDRRPQYDQEMRDAVHSAGYDGLKYQNEMEGPGTSYAISKPEGNLRSPFAAFDPMKKDSSNILASLAAGAALPGLAISSYLAPSAAKASEDPWEGLKDLAKKNVDTALDNVPVVGGIKGGMEAEDTLGKAIGYGSGLVDLLTLGAGGLAARKAAKKALPAILRH